MLRVALCLSEEMPRHLCIEMKRGNERVLIDERLDALAQGWADFLRRLRGKADPDNKSIDLFFIAFFLCNLLSCGGKT